VILIDVDPVGETWYTRHVRFLHQSTYVAHTLPPGNPRTWQPFTLTQQSWTDSLLPRKSVPDSTSVTECPWGGVHRPGRAWAILGESRTQSTHKVQYWYTLKFKYKLLQLRFMFWVYKWLEPQKTLQRIEQSLRKQFLSHSEHSLCPRRECYPSML
jgi:hypothetical protein